MSEIPENQTQKLEIAFPTESDPDIDDPWADDVLKRKSMAEHLTTIVNSAGIKSSLTISVHGEWGTGKTFMLKRWAIDMRKTHKVVYFNAWEDDFMADPIIAIIGQLSKELYGEDCKEKISETIKEVWKPLMEKYFLEKIGLQASDLQSSMELAIYSHVESHAQSKSLRDKLSNLIKQGNKDAEGQERPLVFIIDELDRCMPTFAVKTLKRIKHLFSVPGIVFVFGVDKTNLKKSIRKVYGDINGNDYLRRFFNLELVLPQADSEKFCLSLMKKSGILISTKQPSHSSMHNLLSTSESVNELFAPMSRFMKLSLREVEHTIRLLIFVLLSDAKNRQENEQSIVWGIFSLIIIKIKQPELYSDIVNGNLSCKDIIDKVINLFPNSNNLNADLQKKSTLCQNRVEDVLYTMIADKSAISILHEIKIGRKLSSNAPSLVSNRIMISPEREKRATRILNVIENFKDLLDLQKIANLLDLADNSPQ